MKKIIALAALAALSAGASAANLLSDGSFESVSEGDQSWSIVSTLPGWFYGNSSSDASIAGIEVRNNVAGTAQDGHNFVELDGNENDFISQTFNTVIGKTYVVSFWYSDRTGVAASSQGFEANIESGATSVTVDRGAVGDNGAAWHEETFSFLAKGKHTTFTISAEGTSDSVGTSFDNFNVSAIPEPATLGLFAAGLAMLGMSARRRKQ